MKTIKDVFADFRKALNTIYDVNELEAITLLTVSEICHLSKTKIKAFPELELLENKAEELERILNELKTGKPIQYILGKTEFYGLPFFVDESVLIPRPETEELVEWAISSVGSSQFAVGNILDIGTGSGCIAISLKKNLSAVNVSAIDISKAALDTAKRNAKLNNVNIQFIEDDILNSTTHHSPLTTNYSLIISNPPYVTVHDKTQMHINVTDFEPHNALFVPENDPLIFYHAIAGFALTNLSENGFLFFEINESLGKETVKLLTHKRFKNIELRKDMSGRDRMIKAILSSNAE